MQRLGKNRGGYFGERLDAPSYLETVEGVARTTGWEIHRLTAGSKPPLLAFRRRVSQARLNVYLSTGIHGDEPAGPKAMLELLQQDRWPTGVSLWACPCLNPTGFEQGTRENHEGIDLNRDYRHRGTAEVKAHVEWLERQPQFDVALCLHEDWEANGFYVYELNHGGGDSLATGIVERVREFCPIQDAGQVDGRTAIGGIIRPTEPLENRPQWPEALFLSQYKAARCYTLEAPSDYPLGLRTQALVAGVQAVCDRLQADG